MNSSEFDRRFDVGDAVFSALDGEATPFGVTRRSPVIVWLAGRLEHRTESSPGTLANPKDMKLICGFIGIQ